MTDSFDAYHVWLGIPPAEQPPNHYRLLGIPLLETNREVIAVGASRQIAHIKAFSVGPYADVSQFILKQLSQAKLCLLHPTRKAQYDAALQLAVQNVSPAPQAPSWPTSVGPPPTPPWPAPVDPQKPLPPPVPAAPSDAAPAAASKPALIDSPPASFPGAAAGGARRRSASPPPGKTSESPTPSAAMLPPSSWLIGNADDCDVVMRQPTVSRHHCRLTRTNDGFLLEDLDSTNGTFVNGHRIAAPTKVTPADRIRLGRRTVLPWPVGSATSRALRIGALADNDIVLDGPMVSGHHAVLWIENNRITIEDLGSTNGTSIGKRRRPVERAVVRLSDTLYFGSYAISVGRLLEMAPRQA